MFCIFLGIVTDPYQENSGSEAGIGQSGDNVTYYLYGNNSSVIFYTNSGKLTRRKEIVRDSTQGWVHGDILEMTVNLTSFKLSFRKKRTDSFRPYNFGVYGTSGVPIGAGRVYYIAVGICDTNGHIAFCE